MKKYNKDFFELLSEQYPTTPEVCAEIINLRSVLSLPKGTEHFISDLHGEYDAVRHILNNCSGVILEKVIMLFEDEMGEDFCRNLCSVIYYPTEELKSLNERGLLTPKRETEMLRCLGILARTLSSKYTRSYVRKHIPEEQLSVIDELLHMQDDEDENKQRYHDAIIDSIITTGSAVEVISALSELIKRLAVDRLHVVGDIFDRGSAPEKIVELLMQQPNLDIQWGNHDILWMGAAAGGPASVFGALRFTMEFENMDLLERGYGISLRPLSEFCERVYGGATSKIMLQALNVIGYKLEGQIIHRHPGFKMEERLLLEKIDLDKGTVELEIGEYPLNTTLFPTVSMDSPYELTEEEKELSELYVKLFRKSRALHRHIDFIFKKGSTYLCCNGNLLYHGCIPLTPEGELAKVRYDGKEYSGKKLMDYADRVVSKVWVGGEKGLLDMMWYLWCGKNSPFSGRCFHNFERSFIDDKSTWEEPRNPYFDYWESAETASMILAEFGLDPQRGHIINGHTPVKAIKGESPVKAGGRLFIIDGGICEAYRSTTGIAGYTLIFNSHGLRLKSHRPFTGIAGMLDNDANMESYSQCVETFPRRMYIADTDEGERLKARIEALEELLSEYRRGELSGRRTSPEVN